MLGNNKFLMISVGRNLPWEQLLRWVMPFLSWYLTDRDHGNLYK